jgi:microsomal epoxide hydrolase
MFALPPVPQGAKIEKPVGIAAFPVDIIPFPPRTQAEKSLNIVRWTEFTEGGHFAALERGEDLVKEIRAFAREL